MFPIRDTIRSRSYPIVNWLLIGVNVLVFLTENNMTHGELNRMLNTFGLVPVRLSTELINHPGALLTIFSHFFLHGGWFHLISNMWILFIFGDNIEDRMGHRRYLIFYLLSGIVAGFAQVAVMRESSIPIIGASGAIAGVLGAYFLLFPKAKVTTLVPLFLFWFVDIPAVVFLGFWFFLQLFSGVFSLSDAGSAGGVGWWAHISGFLFGVLIYRFFTKRRTPTYYTFHPYDDLGRHDDWIDKI